MKQYACFLCIACLALAQYATAQTKAITDKGEEVILNKDGTWQFSHPVAAPAYDTRLDTPVYRKPDAATFQVKSNINGASVWINPKQWSFKKKKEEQKEDYEYFFELKTGAYAMVINEEIEIPLSSLADIALTNMKNIVDPSAHISRKEIRKINGHIVIYQEVVTRVNNIELTYMGYYYSDKNGTTQLLSFTSSSLLKKYKKDMEDFLNGLDIRANRE